MRRLCQVTMVMGSYSAVNLALGLFRSKYSALVLGPEGVGLYAQANNALLLSTTLFTLCMSTGMVRRFAEALHEGDPRRTEELFGSCFRLFLALGAGAGLALAVGSGPAAGFLMNDPALAPALLGLAVAIPCTTLATFFECVQMGAGRYDLYTRASIVGALLMFAPFVSMSWFWGLRGAIVSLGVGSALRTAVFSYYAARAVAWRPRLTGRISARALWSLFGISAAMFATSSLLEVSNLCVRTLIVNRLGAAANGIFQVPLALSSYSSVFFTNALWGHVFPKLSRGVDRDERSAEIDSALRFVALGTSAMVAAVLTVRVPLINVLYSARFGPAAPLVSWYALGDLFYVLALVLSISELTLSRYGVYVAAWVAYCVTRVAASWALLIPWGLTGPAAAYTVGSALMFAILAADQLVNVRLRVTRATAVLLLGAPVVLAAPSLLPVSDASQSVARVAMLALGAPFVFTRDEVASWHPWHGERGWGLRRHLGSREKAEADFH